MSVWRKIGIGLAIIFGIIATLLRIFSRTNVDANGRTGQNTQPAPKSPAEKLADNVQGTIGGAIEASGRNDATVSGLEDTSKRILGTCEGLEGTESRLRKSLTDSSSGYAEAIKALEE